MRTLGADVVIDYRTQDFGQLLSGYDLVLDSLGGENLAKSLRILKPGGLAVGISGPPDPDFARAAALNPVLRAAIWVLSSKVRGQAKKLGVRYQFLCIVVDGHYTLPQLPGYSAHMYEESVAIYSFPDGEYWASRAAASLATAGTA